MNSPASSSSAEPTRIVEPELLDELPANDPRAVRSRADLQRVNWFMGNQGILGQVLLERFSAAAPKRIVELGAGDGTLLLKIARRFPEWRDVEATLVDQQEIVSAETIAAFRELGWRARNVKMDVFAWATGGQSSDLVIANLFLHHIQPEPLSRLFDGIARQTKVFAACEPRRTRFTTIAKGLLWIIGCNEVTRHDAAVSIRAGFAGEELSSLWPRSGEWQISERKAGFFSHLFVAERRL